jgi:hypothetical protein
MTQLGKSVSSFRQANEHPKDHLGSITMAKGSLLYSFDIMMKVIIIIHQILMPIPNRQSFVISSIEEIP